MATPVPTPSFKFVVISLDATGRIEWGSALFFDTEEEAKNRAIIMAGKLQNAVIYTPTTLFLGETTISTREVNLTKET